MPGKLRKIIKKAVKKVTAESSAKKRKSAKRPTRKKTSKTPKKTTRAKRTKKTVKKSVKKKTKAAKRTTRSTKTRKPKHMKKQTRTAKPKRTTRAKTVKKTKGTSKKAVKRPKKTARTAVEPKKPRARVAKKSKATAKKQAKKPAKKVSKKATKKPATKKPTKKAAKPPKKPAVKETKPIPKPATKPAKKEEPKPVLRFISKKELESVRVLNPKLQPWLPERSKLKAAIENGMPESYLRVQRILYLGAAHGYTISHIHEIPVELYAVEKSRVMMQHFLPVAEDLPTVLPIFADASSPDSFAHHIPEKVDVVFQDIAQRDQVGIFLSNCERYLAPHGVGILALKARNVSSTAEPAAIFAETRIRLEQGGATIVQEISLEPFQDAHKLFVIHTTPFLDW